MPTAAEEERHFLIGWCLASSGDWAMSAPVPDPILLRSHGGDGSAEIEALLGDKILDLLLYWRLGRRFDIKSEGRLTQLRSVYVSNQTMAAIGERFIVPRHMNRFAWEAASIHEKGTAVEAIVGRSFLQHNDGVQDFTNLSISPTTVKVAYDILDAIEACVKTSAERILSGLSPDAADPHEQTMGHKNPTQALFEWLQVKFKITKPAETISFVSMSGVQSGIVTESKFVAEFRLPPNMRYSNVGARTDVQIRGDPCSSKKLARDNVARYVLRYFKIDSTLSFAAAMRKPLPPSQQPPPAYLMPKIDPKKEPPPYEKPPSSRLYEWLQKNGVSYPAKTIEVIDLLGEHDVTRDGAFQGVFKMPDTDPPEVVWGGKFANKRDAKEDLAAAVLARYNVSSSTSPADDSEYVSDGSMRPAFAPPAPSDSASSIVTASSKIVQLGVSCVEAKMSVTSDGNGIRRTETVPMTSSRRDDRDDLAVIWNTIQSKYGRPVSSDGRESLVCVNPVAADASLSVVNQYLGQYCRDVRLTRDDLQCLLMPGMAHGDISVPSVAGLLYFEPHTPWDSTPLREWFEMSWAKKPVNALCLLKARIGAQFMFKFWKCHLNGGVEAVHDALIMVSFWDDGFGPFYGIGVGANPGLAAKAALAQLWPMVKPYVDDLISIAERNCADSEQRAIEATQLAIAAAQSS